MKSNQAYKRFVEKYPEFLKIRQTVAVSDIQNDLVNALINGLLQLEREGQTIFLDEQMDNGDILHVLIRKVAMNPLTTITAYMLVILGITQKK